MNNHRILKEFQFRINLRIPLIQSNVEGYQEGMKIT